MSSYGRNKWPPAPAFIAKLASQDVYANPLDPLSVIGSGGGGSNVPPSGPPGVPEVYTPDPPTTSQINIQWSTLNVTGTPTPTQIFQWATAPTGPYAVSLNPNHEPAPGYLDNYIAGLTPNTPYYFQTIARNSSGAVSSAVVALSTIAGVPPSGPPTVPVLDTATDVSISVLFNVAGITGVPTPQYVTLVGTTTNPSTNIDATLVSGTTYRGVATNLTPASIYYFASLAFNDSGNQQSATSAALSTLSLPPTPVGPNMAPTVPAFYGANVTSVATTFNVAGITGVPTPTYSGLFGNTITPTSNIDAYFISGTTYGLAVSTLLTPATNYYFKSVASNASGVSTSAVSIAISTLASGIGPNVAPSIPEYVPGSQLSNSFEFLFSVSSVTGTPTPTYKALLASSTYPSTFIAAPGLGPEILFTGAYINSQIGSLSTGVYSVQSVASNASGVSTSVVSYMSTSGTGGPPSSGGSNLTFISASPSTIYFSYATAGITADPSQFLLEYLIGTSSPPTGERIVFPEQTLGNVVSTVATGLTSNTNYYVQSYITNEFGVASSISIAQFSTIGGVPPVAPSNVSTIIGIGFLTYGTGGYSNVILDTSQNVAMGNWQTNGVITYPGAEPSPNGVQYLSTLQRSGNKVVMSLGGASSTPEVLSTMFGNPLSYDQGAADLANSIAYAYFKGPAASNPLGYASTAWAGFSFDGLDFDLEAATPSTTSLYVFASTLKANPGFAGKIFTAAPQTPYLSQASGSALNANGQFASFAEMNPGTILNVAYTGSMGNQKSLLSPGSGNLIDYHFLQIYNNASYSYPTGATNGNWNNVVAGWGIQALQAGYPQKHPKIIYGFGTTDATPIFDPVTDAAAFNASLLTANSTIQAFSTVSGVLPYSSITVGEWCAGIGFWAANSVTTSGSSSMLVLSNMYGQPSTLNNMPTNYCMTYGGVFNSSNWGFVGGVNVPVPNARGY